LLSWRKLDKKSRKFKESVIRKSCVARRKEGRQQQEDGKKVAEEGEMTEKETER